MLLVWRLGRRRQKKKKHRHGAGCKLTDEDIWHRSLVCQLCKISLNVGAIITEIQPNKLRSKVSFTPFDYNDTTTTRTPKP
jgi:hypothetical protein